MGLPILGLGDVFLPLNLHHPVHPVKNPAFLSLQFNQLFSIH